MEKNELKPAGVFHYFDEICQVPRPSKKEEKMIAYLKAFGEKYVGRPKTAVDTNSTNFVQMYGRLSAASRSTCK